MIILPNLTFSSPYRQSLSKVVKVTDVAAISNLALPSAVRTGLGNRSYISDFGKSYLVRYSIVVNKKRPI
jgi:hypothetical protein